MIKRRKIKVKDRYGRHTTKEDKIRDSFKNATYDFNKLYKSLSREQQKKISYEDGLQSVQENANEILSSISVDDMDMVQAKSKDKPVSLSKFISIIKSNLNNHLFVLRNSTIGENVGGHSIMFYGGSDEPNFICGVGKSLQDKILPETTFNKIYDPQKNDWERKIESRGWLSAYEIIESWLTKHGVSITNKRFLN